MNSNTTPPDGSRELDLIEQRLLELRSEISDRGHEMDSYKTKTAAAMGLGVFIALLAAGAGYDLATGKAGLWAVLGLTDTMLIYIAAGLAALSLILFLFALLRLRGRDQRREETLGQLEEEFALLLERKDQLLGSRI